MRRLLVLVVLCCAVLVAAQPAPARAHAVLLETVPAGDAILDESPGEVALRFSETVTVLPDGLLVIDPTGQRIDLADAGRGASGEWVRVSLPAELSRGTYLVSWGVISADGHPIRGAFVFHIGEPSAEPPVLAVPAPPSWVDPYASAVRWTEYLAVLAAAGIALFLVLVHDGHAGERRRLRAAVAAFAWVTLATIPFSILAESFRTSGASPSDALASEQIRVVLESGHGLAAVILAVGCLMLLAVVYAMGRSAVISLLPGAAVVVAASAWRGHSAAVDPAWLGLAANVVHTAAAATWFGGLAALAAVTWSRRRNNLNGVAAHVARFSRVALAAFVIVAAAGLVLGVYILPSASALVDTRYGNLLVAKTVLVLLVLALAGYHRFWVVRKSRVNPHVLSTVRLTLVAELAVAVAVVAVTAALVMRDPNPAPPVAAPTGYVSEGFVGDFHFDLRVDPATPGENTIALDFHAIADADPAAIQRVQVQLVESERGIGPFAVDIAPEAPGIYRHTGQELQVPGTWLLTVAVRLSDFEEERLSYEIVIE